MYTDEQKKRIAAMIEAFKGCRKYLHADGAGICWALNAYAKIRDDEASEVAAACARSLISRALGPAHMWLDTWVRYNNTHRLFSRRDMLALRHRWLDQLIADCEAALKD